MMEIIDVTPLRDLLLEVEFSTGERRVFDLKPLIRGALLEPLRDEELFRQVEIEEYFGGLVWPTGAELSPEMIFEKSVPMLRGATV